MRSLKCLMLIGGAALFVGGCADTKKMTGGGTKKSSTKASSSVAGSDGNDGGGGGKAGAKEGGDGAGGSEGGTADGLGDSGLAANAGALDTSGGGTPNGGESSAGTEGGGDGGLGTSDAGGDGGALPGPLHDPTTIPEGGALTIHPHPPSSPFQRGFAVVLGAGNGGGPHLRELRGPTLRAVRDVMAYAADFRGGIRVAQAVAANGDRFVATAAGAGGSPHVRVFVNGGEITSFFAYESEFRGGAYVALGDLNGDGRPDLVTGPGGGGSTRIRAFDLASGRELRNFFAFDSDFRGGARVAAGDLDKDGADDIVAVPGPGGGPIVSAWSGRTGAKIAHFAAWPAEMDVYRGGLHVAVGLFDGTPGIVVGAGSPGEDDYPGYAAPGGAGAPRVTVLDRSGGVLRNFFAFGSDQRFGVRVGTTDFDGDGRSDILACAGHGGSAHVRVFDGAKSEPRELIPGFIAYDEGFRGGCYVAGAARR